MLSEQKLWGGGVALAAALALPTLALAGDPPPPAWTIAVPVAGINTTFGEGCPIESPDALSLFVASNRRDGLQNDIWVVDRSDDATPWLEARMLEEPISVPDAADFCPTPFGRSLLFVSERAGGGLCGGGDMYLSRQSPAGGWSEPVNLGCAPHGPNTAGGERSPALVETPYGTFLFYSTNGTTGHQDIHVSRQRWDGTFGPGRLVKNLNTTYEDLMPNVRERPEGGYEIVFSSNRPRSNRGGEVYGGQDVFYSFAWFLPGPWSAPVNVGPDVNTAGNEQRSTLSRDGKRLYFGRDGDIYMSKRKKE
jgi:hypothetical protein